MNYFVLNGIDFSRYVNSLQVDTVHNSKNRMNAAGTLNVKPINSKKVITVGIIPLDASIASELITELNKFQVTITYLDPELNSLKTINCIVPDNSISYYTIRADKVMTQAYTVTFTEK